MKAVFRNTKKGILLLVSAMVIANVNTKRMGNTRPKA